MGKRVEPFPGCSHPSLTVITIIALIRTDGQIARAFFSEEYKADYALATLDKPYVAFIDGIVMGGTCAAANAHCHTDIFTQNKTRLVT